MKMLGQLMRYVLNINTIWGLMILASFLACVAQHYLPTKTVLPAAALREGENTLTIRTTDRNDEVREFQYRVRLEAGEIVITPDDRRPGRERPWLIAARPAGAALLLEWDCETHGTYQIAVGERVVAAGRLVNLQSLSDAAIDYAMSGFEIALGLVATFVLFLGLMRVGEDAGIVQLVAKAFYPIIRFLFPGVPKDHAANGAIVMNWTTTLLGLGNAATPFGLKAMKELQSLNPHPDVATDSQVMLLGYNTAGLALLPTTLLAVRKAAGCSDPFEIIGTCMFAGAVATVVAIVMVKVLGKLPVFSVKSAVAEGATTAAPAPQAKQGDAAEDN
jgi:spore maturation protein A